MATITITGAVVRETLYERKRVIVLKRSILASAIVSAALIGSFAGTASAEGPRVIHNNGAVQVLNGPRVLCGVNAREISGGLVPVAGHLLTHDTIQEQASCR